MGRLGDVIRRIQAGSLGFQLDEAMVGEHQFEPGAGPPGIHPLEFRVRWGPPDLRRWATPGTPDFMAQPLEGNVTVGGLCTGAPCKGTLELRYLDEHKIRYTFEFQAQGRTYRFEGEKVDIKPWNLHVSHTTCYGRITEAASGRLVSRSVTHFRLRTLPRFLASFRVTRPDGPTTPA